MAKVQRSEEATKSSYLTGTIKKYMEVEQYTHEKFALKLRISESTLRNKLKGYTEFTYEELYAAIYILKIPPEEVLQFFRIRGESIWRCESA